MRRAIWKAFRNIFIRGLIVKEKSVGQATIFINYLLDKAQFIPDQVYEKAKRLSV